MNIVDWEASSAEIAQDMLRAVARAGGYDSLSIWSATLDQEIKHVLASLGFVPADDTRGIADFDPGMLVNTAIDDPSKASPELADWDLSDLENWHLRMIFSDAF